jgi:alpha-mannosidase
MKPFQLLILFILLSSRFSFSQEKKRLYLANDTHTDWMYNGDYEQWKKYVFDMTDFYLKLGEGTIKEPLERQSKWNYDSAIWLWMLEKYKDKPYFDRVIDQLKRQQASVPYNFILPAYGATPAEAVIRGMYYGGHLERKYGIDVDMAVAQENATIPLGLASLWAGSGVKYSWKGVCNCATKAKNVGCRKHEIYYYKGLDDQKVLMKWYSNFGWNAELGGYSEILEPTIAVIQMDTMCNTKRYPYNIAGAFGKGWDNIVNYAYDLQWGINHRTRPNTQVILSNELDFFKDFEKKYGEKLPSETVAFGNEWDILCTSLSEPAAKIKRSLEKLRVAEAMAAVVVSQEPKAFDDLEEMKQRFIFAISTYWIHSWTADGPITKQQVAIWAKGEQKAIADYVDALYERAKQKLSNKIISQNGKTQFYVFNAMNWERNDFADLPYSGSENIEIIDLSNSQKSDYQLIKNKNESILRVFVKGIPSVGYKVFEIRNVKPKPQISKVRFQNGVFENDFYRLKISKSGVITSLFDKKQNREFAKNIDGKFINDLGTGNEEIGDEISIENKGKVSMTIVCKSLKPLKHETRITLYENIQRIDIQNKILENFGDPKLVAFSFDIDNSEVWHEEIGAVIKAKLTTEGGHYADYMSRYDYQSLSHFADVSNQNYGITLSNLDTYFMQIGKSTPQFLDAKSSQINILVGGQVDKENNMGIPNQDGDSLFVMNFSLMPHQGGFNQTNALKFAMEHQTPFATNQISGSGNLPNTIFSFLKNNDTNAILWTLKPSEKDVSNNGVVARFWNMANSKSNNLIEFNAPISKADEVTHVETKINAINTNHKTLILNQNQQQMKSILVELK